MTVKELEEILAGIENKEITVTTSYYSTSVNGYYFKTEDDKETLILTDLCVQPRNL